MHRRVGLDDAEYPLLSGCFGPSGGWRATRIDGYGRCRQNSAQRRFGVGSVHASSRWRASQIIHSGVNTPVAFLGPSISYARLGLVRIKGVSYDVGRVPGENWRPVFEPEVVRRELTIIKDDLHCNAVRICGRDVSRLEKAAEFALELGLDAWLSPELWNKGPEPTLRYAVDAARMAEDLCRRWPGKVVLCIGSELTLFMRGILPGRSVLTRVREMRKNPSRAAGAPALSDYLTRATEKVRGVFSGLVTYASLVWESVDWKETLKYH